MRLDERYMRGINEENRVVDEKLTTDEELEQLNNLCWMIRVSLSEFQDEYKNIYNCMPSFVTQALLNGLTTILTTTQEQIAIAKNFRDYLKKIVLPDGRIIDPEKT